MAGETGGGLFIVVNSDLSCHTWLLDAVVWRRLVPTLAWLPGPAVSHVSRRLGGHCPASVSALPAGAQWTDAPPLRFPRRGQCACVPATPSPPSAALLWGDFAHVVSGVILDFTSLPVLLCHLDQLFLPPTSELWGLGPPALAAPLPSPVACHHHLHWRLSRRCSRPSSSIPHVPRFLLCALQSAREQRLHISLGRTHALRVLSAFPHPPWPRPARFPASALAPAQWPERPFKITF